MDILNLFILCLTIIFVSFFAYLAVKYFSRRITINNNVKSNFRFYDFDTLERHVINEAVFDLWHQYNIKGNPSNTDLKKLKALYDLREELRVYIR